MNTELASADHQAYQDEAGCTLEWTVRGLKQLFDGSVVRAKSPAVVSPAFGQGKWRLLFYPNSGQIGGFISVYFKYEPAEEEVRGALRDEWVAGRFDLAVEIKSLDDDCPIRFVAKTACEHPFSHRTPTWGWGTLIKRDAVYYAAPMVKERDAFKIVAHVKPSDA